ncbi:hypothetical protein AB0L85_10160 [Streptomyces sp. NPDC052051]|uniref:hypothetical protein n=1 Tax=Streptomyces sp. NPDC052051 TaxID=3154649 RepID=UPI0034185B61
MTYLPDADTVGHHAIGGYESDAAAPGTGVTGAVGEEWAADRVPGYRDPIGLDSPGNGPNITAD